jgi:hypothetical protein
MTSTTTENGRLGNQIFRNIAVSMIAKKHNLKVDYANYQKISEQLGIPLFSGSKVHNEYIMLDDDNFFEVLSYPTMYFTYNLYADEAFFQTKDISQTIYGYLRHRLAKTQIMRCNPFSARYEQNQDIYIHIRLTDLINHTPGYEYFANLVRKIPHEQLYISTDEETHSIITQMKQTFPKMIILQMDEIQTMQFASTCRHVILSHSTFSAIIGYIAYYSTVYYPSYQPGKTWCGDIFRIFDWISIPTGNLFHT